MYKPYIFKLSTAIFIILIFLADFGVFKSSPEPKPEYIDLIYVSTDCTEFNEWTDAWCICKEYGEVWIGPGGIATEPWRKFGKTKENKKRRRR